MNRDPILFRVDGTPHSGWERLNRCLIYAAALQRRRRPAYFLSQLEPAHFALALKRAGNEWLEADGPAGTTDDLTETVREVRRLRPAAVIVDSAEASESYLGELAATGTLVVSIDHLARTRFPSHLVVNPLLDPGRDSYEFYPGTQLLLGRRYALIRPEVRRVRQMRAQEPAPPFRALVAVGDEDTQGHTVALTRRLLQISRLDRIDLAVRPTSPALKELQELAAAHPTRLDLAVEPAELTARIPRCHFAITRGDGWSVELACVGVPQLVIVQAEAHWPSARRLEDEGAAVCLGDWDRLTPASLRQAIQDLLGDPLERQAMARCGRKLIDGRGPDRLVTALEVLLHPSRLIDFQEAA
jgi:spore coat polysaccharide biosynthesis predicted glycosyltransferase SpsG